MGKTQTTLEQASFRPNWVTTCASQLLKTKLSHDKYILENYLRTSRPMESKHQDVALSSQTSVGLYFGGSVPKVSDQKI